MRFSTHRSGDSAVAQTAVLTQLPQPVRNIGALKLFLRTPQAVRSGRRRDSQWPAGCCYDHSVLKAPLAQLAEQRTLNPRVRGSSPWRRTRTDLGFYQSQVIFTRSVCPGFPAALAP